MSRGSDRAGHTITRELLESNRLREMILANAPETRVLDDTELRGSIECMLSRPPRGVDPSRGVWVFGYGSLPWNPCIEVDDERICRIHGFHRDFCLNETDGRGSLQYPGLTLALAPGGACRGIGLRVPGRDLRRELLLLWRREMVTNVYRPRWVRMHMAGASAGGIAFVVNRAHPSYLGRLSTEDIAHRVATGHGPIGPCAEYLERTVAQLARHGIRDRHLEDIEARVRALQGDA